MCGYVGDFVVGRRTRLLFLRRAPNKKRSVSPSRNMVAAFHQNMLRFLNQLHRSTYIVGLDALTRANGMPRPRTLYRWHHTLGDRLIYYPAVAYSAFGLVHWHLIIEE